MIKSFALFTLLSSILIAAACTSAPPAQTPQPTVPSASETPVPTVSPEPTDGPLVGEPFTLAPGEDVILASAGLHVQVVEVQGHDDDVTVSVARDGGATAEYALNRNGPDAVDLDGLSLQLLSVYPSNGANTASVRLMVQAGEQVVNANNGFAFDLVRELREQEGEGNRFVSPLSIAMALAMTYNGAAGGTEQAMAEALHLAGLGRDIVNQGNAALLSAMAGREPELELGVANSLWAKEGVPFHQEFFDRVSQHYNAEVESLPFDDAAKERINGWVDEQTNGKIDSILEEIKPGDVMYLINAIYFNASWLYPFDEEDTEDGTFHNADGSAVEVPMMRQSWAKYDYLDGDKFSALRLPYDGQASMYIFLPDHESSLPEFLNGLDPDSWMEWMDDFQRDGSGNIIMPRFELEYDSTLNDTLKAMGMEVAFGGGADFSDMGPGGLYIDRVVHKSVVEVHELGTEAAAATMVAIDESGPAFTFEFTVDRPFFFAITDDQTGSVLFTGEVHELDGD